MSSHHHHHHPNHQSPPPPPLLLHPPSYLLYPPPPPHPSHDHLLQAIASLLHSQQSPYLHPHDSQSHTPHNPNPNPQSTISSLLHRIESLESSLNHHTHQSLRHAAARVIQTHFRSFLVRRSKTLRHLKQLAYIKSSLASLRSSFSSRTRFDFPPLSLKAVNLLLELDSIQACDPMVADGKRSISRDLIQFLDSIEEVAAIKQVRCVKPVKSFKSGQSVQRQRNSGGDDEKKKLLKNLRGRVEKISKLCKVYGNDEEEGSELENGFHDHDDNGEDDGVTNVLIGRRDEVSQTKNRVLVQRKGGKKNVRFAENGAIYEVFSSRSCESDGSLSNDDQGEVFENVSSAVVEDIVESSHGVGDDEEVLVVESGGSTQSSDDGEKNYRRDLKKDDTNKVREQFQEQQEKLLFSAPLILKMENRSDLKKSKG